MPNLTTEYIFTAVQNTHFSEITIEFGAGKFITTAILKKKKTETAILL